MNQLNRRNFLKTGVLASAAGSLLFQGYSSAQAATEDQPVGANDAVRVAVVGFRGQGAGHIDRYLKIPGVRLVALCDADEDILDKKAADLDKKNIKVEKYKDIRKLLENKDIDAISIATPNHWHALMAIWACQAGKDVYVEKPCSHNVWEGRKLVEAARKYKRIVQIGTQLRSSQGYIQGIQWIKEGNIGKIVCARGLCYKFRDSIGKVKGPQKPPARLDYDLWTGPAPLKPLMRKELHYDWHWDYDTGCGDIGNQGIHQMDIARWALGYEDLSPRVLSIGGRFGYQDDANTANTQIVIHDYPIPLIFEVYGLPMKAGMKEVTHYKGVRTGNIIHCEGGYFSCGHDGSGKAYDKDGKVIKEFSAEGVGAHQDNFIAAVRSRKIEDLHSDIEGGHISSALCHTANASYRLGTLTEEKDIREAIKDKGDLAIETFERFKAHLAANNVDLGVNQATLGPWLKFDTKTERFDGNDPYTDLVANAMITRNYREPFVVPEKV